MSASLVGSEMCIRDRTYDYSTPLLLEGSEGVPRGLREGSEVAAAPGDGGPCLLYTSDAADDM
eukprot:6788044-Alexandrium_andersonii.AAC.1